MQIQFIFSVTTMNFRVWSKVISIISHEKQKW